MFELRTEIEIEAPAATVWAILTDTSMFPTWNPFIHRVEGELRLGSTLEVELGAPGKSKMIFKPTVVALEPNRALRWLGKLFMRGLFDGEHIFELEPKSNASANGTRFIHREEFSGLLVPLFRRLLERDTRPGFEAMNQALKVRAEAQENAHR
ncbi:MAG: SRPBCC domain-containing protein [Deltaproteobacteria bacterium]|nr:SRPBCC domain-containing protein [Deltaproteobacteria bacterium]